MNCCNGETSEVVAVIMNVSTSFTATILIYRQGSSARQKYCQPGKFRIVVYKQKTVRNRWVNVRKIFSNDAKNFNAFRLFLPLFFRFAPFSCIPVLADVLLLQNAWILHSVHLYLFFFVVLMFTCSTIELSTGLHYFLTQWTNKISPIRKPIEPITSYWTMLILITRCSKMVI